MTETIRSSELVGHYVTVTVNETPCRVVWDGTIGIEAYENIARLGPKDKPLPNPKASRTAAP